MYTGTSLAVQWLRLCASTAGGAGSIPGEETKIPHVANKQTDMYTQSWIIKLEFRKVGVPDT